ncbi:S1C family serine protease [Telmatospirillum sp. J64-1]|uniref:S1C family serine protease n=1 Tax=Telmatospirillum sp. J64-1 TaxID=2502183 RepID=UPI00115E96B0|nr:S1C family serine protease [Telmatospirillum sp. J64-1]
MPQPFRALRLILPTAAVLVIAACQGTPVHQAEQRPVVTLSPEAQPQPIRYLRTVFDIKRGTTLGGFKFVPLSCDASIGQVSWGSGRLTDSSVELADLFHEALTGAGYDVVGDPRQIFEQRRDAGRAVYSVGGRVSEIQFNLCRDVDWFWGTRTGTISGDGFLRVTWQVYDNLNREIIYETTTEGSFSTSSGSVDGEAVILGGAFAAAAANLAADAGFRRLVTSGQPAPGLHRDGGADLLPVAVRAYDGPAMRLDRVPAYTAPIAAHMDQVRAATVTVITPDGHGSGFFISPKGYLLTNAHVTGGARLVKVRLLSGREVVAEVLRVNEMRDVALLLVEESHYPALPVRDRMAQLGEDVLAIGAPTSPALSHTLTKGVVSSIRRQPRTGLDLIQSDVTIHGGNSGGPLLDGQGNLVGMAVAGYLGESGDTMGLNLFIPIHDALEKLNLRLD